jgi:hypothetical protein
VWQGNARANCGKLGRVRLAGVAVWLACCTGGEGQLRVQGCSEGQSPRAQERTDGDGGARARAGEVSAQEGVQ